MILLPEQEGGPTINFVNVDTIYTITLLIGNTIGHDVIQVYNTLLNRYID